MEHDWSLQRRDVLRAGVGATTLAALGSTASASETTDASYAPRGQIDVEGAAEVVVTPDGDAAFVAVGSGFVSVDVSDPVNPSVVGSAADLEGPDGDPVRQVLDVKYDDGQLLVPTAAQGASPRGFYLFDVSDPANPTRVGDWFPTPDHGNHNAALRDGVAYLTGGLVVDVVDVSGDSFERLAQWEPGDWNDDWSMLPNTVLHDLSVQGDRAYCAYWDAGVFVLDVSDPANPSFVARAGEYSLEEIEELSRQAYLEPGGNAHYVTVNEDATVLAEGGESWDLDAEDDTGGPSGITFYDISDETNPERVGYVDPPVSASNAYQGGTWTTSHNFELANDRLYASWYQGGVTVHDVSDPANPERVAWWAAPNDRAFWTAQVAVPGEFFVASSRGGGGMTGNIRDGLLTFPDAAGEMADAPAGVAWSEDALANQQPATTTADVETTQSTTAATTEETAAGTTEETAAGGSMDSTTSGDEASGDDSTTTGDDGSGSTPGFGVVAALAGLGVGASRLLRGRGDDDA
jgi:hypothetical protein